MEECLFSPQEPIFSSNNPDDCSIYLLIKGKVKIYQQNDYDNVINKN